MSADPQPSPKPPPLDIRVALQAALETTDVSGLPAAQRKTLHELASCGTGKLGFYEWACTECSDSKWLPLSCGNRYCMRCNGFRRAAWTESVEAITLPGVKYAHLVIRLPRRLFGLAQAAPEVLKLFMDAVKDGVLAIGKAAFGGTIGLTEALHTWNSQLQYTPHVHVLATVGALRTDGSFYQPPGDAAWTEQSIQEEVRRRFLMQLRKLLEKSPDARAAVDVVTLNDIDQVIAGLAADPQACVTFRRETASDTQQVIRYLAKKSSGLGLADDQILAFDEEQIVIDGAGSGETEAKPVVLTHQQFISRLLTHTLPQRFQRIRHAGLHACRTRTKKIAQCRQALNLPAAPVEKKIKVQAPITQRMAMRYGPTSVRICCTACKLQATHLRTAHQWRARRRPSGRTS